jgi:hypothetical protein
MAAVDRELKITYGGFVVGGTSAPGSERLIDTYIRLTKSFTNARVEFDFVISATTEALFQDAIEECEDAFRKPFQDLTVEQGAETLIDLKPSTNTGLNTMPDIKKIDNDPRNTGRSRAFTVVVEAQLPADNAPTVGIQESSTNVAYSPARKRQVTITGIATAIVADDARAKYESIIDSFCSAILSPFGSVFELGEEPLTDSGYQDKLISFTRVYDEVIYPEAGATNDPAIVRQSFNITRTKVFPGDFPGAFAKRLVNVSAVFDCWIDKDVTQALESKWASVKNWIVGQIKSVMPGPLAITSISPNFNFTENKISGTVNGQVYTGSGIISASFTTTLDYQMGVVMVPAWSGKALSKYVYQGPMVVTETTNYTRRVYGGGSLGAAAGGGAAGAVQGQNGPIGNFQGGGGFAGVAGGQNGANMPGSGGYVGATFTNAPAPGNAPASVGDSEGIEGLPDLGSLSWRIMSQTQSETPLEIGESGNSFKVTDATTVIVRQAYIPIESPASVTTGGSGGGLPPQITGANATPGPGANAPNGP